MFIKISETCKNVFNRNVFNNALHIKYYSKFREYKKLVKYKKRKYDDYLTNMLSNAMDNEPQTGVTGITEITEITTEITMEGWGG